MWTQEDEIRLNDMKLKLKALEDIKDKELRKEELIKDITKDIELRKEELIEAIRSDLIENIEIEYIPMMIYFDQPSTTQKRVTLIFKVR